VELFESRIAIATLAAFASTACAREGTRARAVAGSAFPVELRDDQGRAVVVRAEPMRIVSLVPSHTETLVALGVGARIVGIDDWSDAPLEATSLPKLGGLYDTHVEEVLALHPDLVLLSESNGAVRALEHAGVTEWAGSAQTFDEIAPAIEAIGKMVGRSAEAAGLVARIGADLAVVEKSVAGEPRVSVYYELDATPYTVGPESFIGVMLVKAGGDNVIPAGTTGPNDMTAFNTALRDHTASAFNYVVPNMCEDGHDNCTAAGNPITQFDDFLAREVPRIEASPAFGADGVVLITWDEGADPPRNPGHVLLAALGPLVRPGATDAARHDHYGLERTLAEGFGVRPLARARRAAAITGIWR